MLKAQHLDHLTVQKPNPSNSSYYRVTTSMLADLYESVSLSVKLMMISISQILN